MRRQLLLVGVVALAASAASATRLIDINYEHDDCVSGCGSSYATCASGCGSADCVNACRVDRALCESAC